MTDLPRLLTEAELATRWGIREPGGRTRPRAIRSIRRLVAEGRLRRVKIGRASYFTEEAVLDFERGCEEGPLLRRRNR